MRADFETPVSMLSVAHLVQHSPFCTHYSSANLIEPTLRPLSMPPPKIKKRIISVSQ